MLLAALVAAAGLYPLQLPDGQTRLAAKLNAESGLTVVEPSSCAPDEEVCLADAAKRAGLDAIASADIRETRDGYFVHLRAFGPDRKLIGEWRGEAHGPDELASALHNGLRETLHAETPAPPPSMTKHAPAEATSGVTVGTARTRAATGLFATGLALLTAAAGAELYARVAPSSGSAGQRALVESAGPQRASTLALALAATGAGAILGGVIVVAVTPQSASMQARF
jgi:hypothetical protein